MNCWRVPALATLVYLGAWSAAGAEPSFSGYYVKTIEGSGSGPQMRGFAPAGNRRGGWAWSVSEIVAVNQFGVAKTVKNLTPDRTLLETAGLALHPSGNGDHALLTVPGKLWLLSTTGGEAVLLPADAGAHLAAFPSDHHLWLTTAGSIVHLDLAGRRASYPLDPDRTDVIRASGDGRFLWCIETSDSRSTVVLLDAQQPNAVARLAEVENHAEQPGLGDDIERASTPEPLFFSDNGRTCWVRSLRGLLIISLDDGAVATHLASGAEKLIDLIPAGDRHALVRTRGGWSLFDNSGQSVPLSRTFSGIQEVVPDNDETHFWIQSGAHLYRVGLDGVAGLPLVSNVFDFAAHAARYRALQFNPFTSIPLRLGPQGWSRDELPRHRAVHVTDRGDALVITETAVLFVSAEKGIRRVHELREEPYAVMAAPDRNVFWITAEGPVLFAVHSDGHSTPFDLRSFPSIAFGNLFPSADGKHVFTGGGRTIGRPYWIAIFDRPADILTASVDFGVGSRLPGSTRIDIAQAGRHHVAIDPSRYPWNMDAVWAGLEWREHARPLLEAWLDKNASAVSGTRATPVQPRWSNAPVWATSYPLELKYTDAYGSDVRVTWAAIYFDIPFLKRVGVLSFLCALVIIGLALLGYRIFHDAKVGPWIPPIITFLGAATPFGSLGKALGVNGLLVATFVGACVIVVIPIGLLVPGFLRTASKVQPFQMITPLLIMLPMVRRGVYAEYINGLEGRLITLRENATNETYCDLPAAVSSPAGLNLSGIIVEPAVSLADVACRIDSSERAHILISAPGGRGKSALLRRVMEIAITRFRADPRSPIPIYCDAHETTVESAAMKDLGRNMLSPEIFAAELEAGHFLLIIDGISETGLPSKSIREYLNRAGGDKSFLLLASRKSEELRDAFGARSAPCMFVEPLPLDDVTLPIFEASYRQHDLKAVALSPGRKRACAGRHGTYLPLLVRMALRTASDQIGNVTDLYEETFCRLADSIESDASKNLKDEASSLCLATYWLHPQRSLAYDQPPPQRSTIDSLRAAGVLVDTEVNPLNGKPRTVRFFHDSMQSYLTACALKQSKKWLCLERAAGHPKFVSAESDLGTGDGSELFQFCTFTFEAERLREELLGHLQSWAEKNEGDLRKNDLIARTATIVCAEVPKEASSGTVLLALIDAALRADAGGGVPATLAALYSRVAPLIWSYRRSDVEAALGLVA
jgi:hypothetical protein